VPTAAPTDAADVGARATSAVTPCGGRPDDDGPAGLVPPALAVADGTGSVGPELWPTDDPTDGAADAFAPTSAAGIAPVRAEPGVPPTVTCGGADELLPDGATLSTGAEAVVVTAGTGPATTGSSGAASAAAAATEKPPSATTYRYAVPACRLSARVRAEARRALPTLPPPRHPHR